jgi:hypothetical protein
MLPLAYPCPIFADHAHPFAHWKTPAWRRTKQHATCVQFQPRTRVVLPIGTACAFAACGSISTAVRAGCGRLRADNETTTTPSISPVTHMHAWLAALAIEHICTCHGPRTICCSCDRELVPALYLSIYSCDRIWSFYKKYYINKYDKELFLNITFFQYTWCDFQQSYTKLVSTTHFHVSIGCHVNLVGLTTPFDIQNKSHHFDWRDSSMSHVTPLSVIYFRSKLASLFCLSFNIFYN